MPPVGYYQDLDSRAIVGRFYRRYETQLSMGWARRVAFFNPDANQETETYKMLGAAPMMRAWLGARQAKQLAKYSLAVSNQKYETTLEFGDDDLRRDKTGQIMVRVGEMAKKAAELEDKIATDVLTNNDTSYTGTALFGSHTIGSNTWDNDLVAGDVAALNISSASAPTQTEAATAIVNSIQQMYSFLDEFDDPINGGAKRWLVVCPTNFWGAFMGALRSDRLNSGNSNVLLAQDLEIDVAPNARLDADSTTKFYIFRTDVESGGLILQEEAGLELSVLGRDSDHYVKHDKHLFGAKRIMAAAPGEPGYCCRCTFS